jgi:hypothetical protein
MTKRLAAILTIGTALAGCGGGGSPAASSAGGWDGTKACETLKQADVEAVTGQKAQAGKLDAVNQPSEGRAATSMCSYALADGGAVTFLSRVSEGEDLQQALAAIKNPPAGMEMGRQEDVAGVGKAALWNETTHQLQFWLDGDHFGIVGIMRGDFSKQPDLSKSKEQAIALAKRLGA